MRASILAALILLPASQARAADPPQGYVSETLPNGLVVSILDDPLAPVVATQVWYHVGSADEDAGSRGLAHLFEHLMFGRTSHHGERDYWEYHHASGGENNAYTTPDETVYVSEIAPDREEGVLGLEADRMVNLVLEPSNLDNEKKIVTEELRLRAENSPETRVMVAAQRALLRDHPYAFDPSGSKEDVARATVESCRAFYDHHYHPNHAHLVIVGPVDPRRTQEAVERAFGSIPPGGVDHADVPPLLGWSYPGEVDLEEDLPPVETSIIGFPLPPVGSEDAAAIEVLIQLLGRGSVDPFREDLVRRRRKAVAAGTEVIELRRGGAILFYAASLPYRRKATAFRLMEETRATLSRLEWLDEQKLASAKRALELADARQRYYASSEAEAIGRALWWDGDDRRAFDRMARIRAVTLDQVAAAYRRYVGQPAAIRLYIRPEHVPLYVRLFGWLYPLVSR